MKKILVLCDAGEVRSVAMAKVLRGRGHFAVAGSHDNWLNARADLDVDMYIFMNEGGLHFIGRDEWGDIDHQELVRLCQEKATELGL